MYIGIPVALVLLYLAYTMLAGKKANADDEDQLTLSDVVSVEKGDAADVLDADEKLLQALDQHEMDFEKELSGNLTKDGFVNLRNLITSMTQQEFKPTKEELMQQRVQAYKNNDWQNYAKFISQAASTYQQL